MDIKRVLAVGFIGVAIIVNGCGQKSVPVESNSLYMEEIQPDTKEVKYVTHIDIGQTGLELDYLNKNIMVSPDGKLGVLVASKVPKSKLPKGQHVDYESHLVLVDLMKGEVSSLDNGQYITPIEWSSEGDKILYRKDDNLYIIEIADKTTYIIASRAYCGSISPDGTRVAFVQREKGMFISGTNGLNLKKLSGEPGDWYPVWYPDGRSLFYFADRQVELGDGAGRMQGLGRIDVETGDKNILIPDEKGKYRSAEWIISGKTLLVDKGWDDLFSKLIVDVENGKVYQLGELTGVNMYAAAVDRTRGMVYKALGSKITGFDANGRETVAFSIGQPRENKFPQETGVAVSPDGRRLVYMTRESTGDGMDGGSRVWMVNADGSNSVELTRDFRGYFTPVWTPDAEHIITLEGSKGTDADRSFTVKILNADADLQ